MTERDRELCTQAVLDFDRIHPMLLRVGSESDGHKRFYAKYALLHLHDLRSMLEGMLKKQTHDRSPEDPADKFRANCMRVEFRTSYTVPAALADHADEELRGNIERLFCEGDLDLDHQKLAPEEVDLEEVANDLLCVYGYPDEAEEAMEDAGIEIPEEIRKTWGLKGDADGED